MTLKLELGYAEHCFQNAKPCGDGWASMQRHHTLRLMLVDGMGHGMEAHKLMNQLCKQFQWLCGRTSQLVDIADCMRELHEVLRIQKQSDQAAVALVDVHTDTGLIAALSVGNVKAHILTPGHCFSFPCMNGMVGGHLPQELPVTVHPYHGSSLLTLHSDGVSSRSVLPFLSQLISSCTYSHLRSQAVAEAVIRDHAKCSDDAACLVVMLNQTPLDPTGDV